MTELNISDRNAGQRLDKYLLKYLNAAPKSFVYKMLRKKNIKLNGQKASGNEILSSGDIIFLYLSNDTIDKFKASFSIDAMGKPDIIYEDDNILIANKPPGLESQSGFDSINSMILAYLLETQTTDPAFTPGIANRLDKNTSGIILCGKNYGAARALSDALSAGVIDKYYYAIVYGELSRSLVLTGYHTKDENTNTALITAAPRLGAKLVFTDIQPVCHANNRTLLKIKLITGRSHQIRAHLQSIGYPIIGDIKYGVKDGRPHQLLHAGEVVFGGLPERLNYLNGRRFTAKWPSVFLKAYKEYFRG